MIQHGTIEMAQKGSEYFIPIIQEILKNEELEIEKVTAIKLLEILVESSSNYDSPINEKGNLISNILLSTFGDFINIFSRFFSSNLIVEQSIKFLFTLLRLGFGKNPNLLTEETKQSVVPPIFAFVAQLLQLNPNSDKGIDDYGIIDLGWFMCYLSILFPDFFSLEKQGELIDIIVKRLSVTSMGDLKNSLLAVLVRFICLNTNEIIYFLNKNNYLINFLQFWLKNYLFIENDYFAKISLISFCKILLSGDCYTFLDQILVPSELVSNKSSHNLRKSDKSKKSLTPGANQQLIDGELWSLSPATSRMIDLIISEYFTFLDQEKSKKGNPLDDGFDDEFGDEFGEEEDEDGDFNPNDNFDDDFGEDDSFNEENEWDPYGEGGDGDEFCDLADLIDDYNASGSSNTFSLPNFDPLTKNSIVVCFHVSFYF